MKLKKTCSNCIKGVAIPVNSDIFCHKKGIVSYNYVCRKHKFSPEAKALMEMNYKCIHCDNFLLDDSDVNNEALGICQLFSVRQFNGNDRNACSKFIKKKENVPIYIAGVK